jgi:hypothetical protein
MVSPECIRAVPSCIYLGAEHFAAATAMDWVGVRALVRVSQELQGVF